MYEKLSQSPNIELWRALVPDIQEKHKHEFTFNEDCTVIAEFYDNSSPPDIKVTAIFRLLDSRMLLVTFDYYGSHNYVANVECLVKNSYFTPEQQGEIHQLEKTFIQGTRIA